MSQAEEPHEVDSEDPVVLAIDACLAAQANGQAWSAEDYRELVADRWDEFVECVELLHQVGPLAEVMQQETDAELVPEQIGPYPVARLLGVGGFSRVYLSLDPKLGRPVAIKCFAASHTSIDNLRNWIATEARSLAQVNHECVLKVHELLDTEHFQAVVTEYVPGPSLADTIEALRDDGSSDISPESALRGRAAAIELTSHRDRARLIAKLAHALAACHAAGVLHRDIKPSNVLLLSGKEPKLIDFGLSHLLEAPVESAVTEAFVGSPAYLAPEQIEEEQTGARAASDLFSLGVVLYELLTLRQPFIREGRRKTMNAVLAAEPTPPRKLDPSIPRDLQSICLHAMERRPEQRYTSAQAMAEDLEAFLEHRDIQSGPPSSFLRARRFVRKHRNLLAATFGGAFLALAIRHRVHASERTADIAQWSSDVQEARDALPRLSDLDTLEMNEGVANLLETEKDLRLRARELGTPPSDFGRDLATEVLPLIRGCLEKVFQDNNLIQSPDFTPTGRIWETLYPRLNQLPSFPDLTALRCRVTLPESTRLMKVGLQNNPHLTEVRDLNAVEPGLYRMVQRLEKGEREQEFAVYEGLPLYEPQFVDRPDWVAKEWKRIEIPAKDRALIDGSDTGPRPFFALRFDSTNEYHTKGMSQRALYFLREMAKEMREVAKDKPVEPNGFSPTWIFASEFAKHIGGRIASVSELRILCRQGYMEDKRYDYWTNQAMQIDGVHCYASIEDLRSTKQEINLRADSGGGYSPWKSCWVVFRDNSSPE